SARGHRFGTKVSLPGIPAVPPVDRRPRRLFAVKGDWPESSAGRPQRHRAAVALGVAVAAVFAASPFFGAFYGYAAWGPLALGCIAATAALIVGGRVHLTPSAAVAVAGMLV